jgi:hypothetical protein
MKNDEHAYLYFVYRFYDGNLKAEVEGYRQDQFPSHYHTITVTFSSMHQWL